MNLINHLSVSVVSGGKPVERNVVSQTIKLLCDDIDPCSVQAIIVLQCSLSVVMIARFNLSLFTTHFLINHIPGICII